jgi:polyferredoxin
MVSMIKNKLGRKAWRLARWRIWVQLGFLLAWLEPLPQWHGLCAPVFHCYSCPLATFSCPIGILANYSALHLAPLLAIGILLVVGSIFGSLVCGWACPFGLLQDLLGRIPLPKFRLPGFLGWTRYAVLLGLVFVLPYFFGDGRWFFICRLCPAGALEASVPYSVQQSLAGHGIVWLSWSKAAILIAFLVLSLLMWRPWCTLLCPLGAFFSVCNYVSLMFLRFQPGRCNDCELCRDLCKYRGPSERRGSDLRCIRCLECANCRALSIGTVFQKRDQPAATVQITPP